MEKIIISYVLKFLKYQNIDVSELLNNSYGYMAKTNYDDYRCSMVV